MRQRPKVCAPSAALSVTDAPVGTSKETGRVKGLSVAGIVTSLSPAGNVK